MKAKKDVEDAGKELVRFDRDAAAWLELLRCDVCVMSGVLGDFLEGRDREIREFIYSGLASRSSNRACCFHFRIPACFLRSCEATTKGTKPATVNANERVRMHK